MNPVQAIVKARLKAESFRKARIEDAVVQTVAGILIALAESDEYQLEMTHFMDYFPEGYADLEDVYWTGIIFNELKAVVGINAWRVDGTHNYIISSSASNLLEADLSKYFK